MSGSRIRPTHLVLAAVAGLLLAPGGLPAGALSAAAQEAAGEARVEGASGREDPDPRPSELAGPASRTWTVRPDGPIAAISGALDSAGPGDTIRVLAGRYRERLVIDRPVTLIGVDRPVIDAAGEGHVIEASAPVEVRGFELRDTGTNPDEEHAGVMVRDARAWIADNVLEDVYYGIYLKNSPVSVVRGNRITGKPMPPPRRGDGIRLWYSSDTEIVDNAVTGTRDVVVFFSDRLSIRGNLIREGRYGLHYMYSNHNHFERNRFVRNQVGAFIMYSSAITLEANLFAESGGASGLGLGLKDADSIRAAGNLFVENEAGVYLDNSPRSRDVRNRFERNVFFGNDAGLRTLPSVTGNVFRDNDFVSNHRPVEVTGGVGESHSARNDWRGNFWGGYAGFDRDGNGVGDTPYVYSKLSEDLMADHPTLRLFSHSPVVPVVETVSRFFPFLKPKPLVVDSSPKLTRNAYRRWETDPPVAAPGAAPGGSRPTRAAAAAGVLLLAASAGAVGAARRLGRRP